MPRAPRPKPEPPEPQFDAAHLEGTRRIFWHNAVREMLNSLSVLSQLQPELFDGRFALLTMHGERVPIGGVIPVFACSIPGDSWEREASVAVQCSVFRVTTPEGEVFTLPVHEVRAFHELTPELLRRIDEAARKAEDEAGGKPELRAAGGDGLPFGFAAFSAMPKLPSRPAPVDPME